MTILEHPLFSLILYAQEKQGHQLFRVTHVAPAKRIH